MIVLGSEQGRAYYTESILYRTQLLLGSAASYDANKRYYRRSFEEYTPTATTSVVKSPWREPSKLDSSG